MRDIHRLSQRVAAAAMTGSIVLGLPCRASVASQHIQAVASLLPRAYQGRGVGLSTLIPRVLRFQILGGKSVTCVPPRLFPRYTYRGVPATA